MKKLFILLFLLSVFLRVVAQNEQPEDSTLLKRPPTEVNGLLQMAPPSTSSAISNREMPVNTSISADSITLNVPPLPTYTPNLPWMDVKMGKMVSHYDPFVMDYELYDAFMLTGKTALSTFSTYNTYPTMGAIIQAGANYIYRPNERWELSGGMYTAKYTMPSRMHGSQFDIGLDASAAYRINGHLRIRLFGQYSAFGKQNSFNGYMNPMYPQSCFGAVMEWKINDVLEIHGGVERVYDATKMKWVTAPILHPVINLRKKK
ncbi:hypothetical protein [Bacteroides oleiciplenus]|uniref:Uncharacterized protein n=1 Tax=Bacteroides oleiciplenus TaxID=626931 RepID=A0A3E5BIC1_9BACE|nr:hypothetical protein [Bacteroides oleiciplenus]RGN37183.1 hypothetical protein DXB65_06625 [Bacteroides oleiciplenus]